MGYMETYREWCDNQYFSDEARAELASIAGNEAEIETDSIRILSSVQAD